MDQQKIEVWSLKLINGSEVDFETLLDEVLEFIFNEMKGMLWNVDWASSLDAKIEKILQSIEL